MISYRVENESSIPSPALIYYQDQIERNTAEAIRIAGGAERLWPHIKTHKIAELLHMQIAMGICRFKCATAAEVRLAAGAGAEHVLWAYPLVGPNIGLFIQYIRQYPNCTLYALADDLTALEALNQACEHTGVRADVLLDVNLGMNRTGMQPDTVMDFYRHAEKMGNICLCGLHCYDGHIHDQKPDERRAHAATDAAAALAVREQVRAAGYDCSIMILGGTPTFPCHAHLRDVFLSPGTLFVSDHGYCRNIPDIDTPPAAAVLTRVISHPADDLFTLDSGVKAISADADPRGILVGFSDKCTPVLSSEEHWVFRMKPGYKRPPIGAILYAIPTHICPTTALYDAVYVCTGGKITAIWQVAARDRVNAVTPEDLR